MNYAPFRADYASGAQAAYKRVTETDQPVVTSGMISGTVSERGTGAPLTAITVTMRKLVNSGPGPSATSGHHPHAQFPRSRPCKLPHTATGQQ